MCIVLRKLIGQVRQYIKILVMKAVLDQIPPRTVNVAWTRTPPVPKIVV